MNIEIRSTHTKRKTMLRIMSKIENVSLNLSYDNSRSTDATSRDHESTLRYQTA